MKTLFLAWQDPRTRKWFPVGRLTFDGNTYEFVYTQGAEIARSETGFQPFQTFPSFHETYESDELFPLFANRVPPRQRPDFSEFVQYLNVAEDTDDPMVLLVRSGGRRETDTLELIPFPEEREGGEYHIHFFVHGLNHVPDESLARIERLQTGEQLLLVYDLQNAYDHHALALRTNDSLPRDRYFLGYLPRYLSEEAFSLLRNCDPSLRVRVEVERVNPPPAPLQLRLLCSLTACWPTGFQPFAGDLYQPMATNARSLATEDDFFHALGL